MILSRKKLYKIKKTKEQSRRRRKHRNKKKYRRRKRGKSRGRKKALNLRKRTMKVYRGGVNRTVLSFVFPNDSNQLVLVSFNPSKTGNSSGEFQAKTMAKAFINAACRITESVHLEDGETDDSWKSTRIMREMVEAIRTVANGNKDSEAITGISPRAFSSVVITHDELPVTYGIVIGAINLRDLNRSLLQKQLQGEGFLGLSPLKDFSQAARSLAKQVGIQITTGRSFAESASKRAEKTTNDEDIPAVVVGDDESKSVDPVPPTFDASSTTSDIVAALKKLGEACNPGNGENCADGLTCDNINAEGDGICISSETPLAQQVSEGKKSVDVSFTQALSVQLD